VGGDLGCLQNLTAQWSAELAVLKSKSMILSLEMLKKMIDLDHINAQFSGISFEVARVSQAFVEAAQVLSRPSVIFRPRIFLDGNQWCALYGENIQDGVCGFGDTPDQASRAFDREWSDLKPKQK